MQQRQNRVKRIFAAALAVGALAAALPATSHADGGGNLAATGQAGGGSGGP
jgi:hypothetical protein